MPHDPRPAERRRLDRFAVLPAALARDPGVTLQAKGLYALIRSYADHGAETGARPSQGRLCRDAGITPPRFRRIRDELVRGGWLEWKVTRTKKGKALRTDYLCLDGNARDTIAVIDGIADETNVGNVLTPSLVSPALPNRYSVPRALTEKRRDPRRPTSSMRGKRWTE